METYGVYLYGGYVENQKLQVGYKVIISGQIGYYSGSLQITDVTNSRIKVQSFGSVDGVQIEEVSDIQSYVANEMNVGNVLKIVTPLTITKYYDASNEESNAITLYAKYYDASNKEQEVQIRIDNNVTLRDENGDRITSGSYFVGKKINSLICVLGYYDSSQDKVHNGRPQLMLTSMDDIVYAE